MFHTYAHCIAAFISTGVGKKGLFRNSIQAAEF